MRILLLLAVLFIPWMVCAPPADAPPLWTPITEACGPPEAMYCTSAGLVAPARSGPGSLAATVRITPAADGRFWAGVALNGDVAGDHHYAQAAITHRILPYRVPYAATEGPAAVILADGADRCCQIFGPVDTTQPHQLRVEYDGVDTASICVDGTCATVQITLDTYQPELLCVGVDPGEPGSNPVGCMFTEVTLNADHD